MRKNIYELSDEEIERIIDEFFDRTSKQELIDIFIKAGFFNDFKFDEIKWGVFMDEPSDEKWYNKE